MRYIPSNTFSFNQSLGNWNLNAEVLLTNAFDNLGLEYSNYSSTLAGWAPTMIISVNRNLGAIGMEYDTNLVTIDFFSKYRRMGSLPEMPPTVVHTYLRPGNQIARFKAVGK